MADRAQREQELRQFLEACVTVRGERPKDLAYTCMEDFVLREGQLWTPQKLPRHHQLGTPKQCFGNARLLHLLHGYRYCEGYAAGLIPTMHAWVLDENDRVIDPTWEDPAECVYFGVVLTDDELREVEPGHSAIDNWTEHWPLLQAERKRCDRA